MTRSHQTVEKVRTVATPVLSRRRDDDRGLGVTETLDLLQRVLVLRHIDRAVFDSLTVETTVGGIALNARRLAVDSNQEVSNRKETVPSILSMKEA